MKQSFNKFSLVGGKISELQRMLTPINASAFWGRMLCWITKRTHKT